jgi:putative transcriptional regulator
LITFCKGGITLVRNFIKVLRAQHDLTQADLAEKLGVSRQAIVSIEKYKYTPSLELAFKIANIFNVPITKVFEYLEGESNE